MAGNAARLIAFLLVDGVKEIKSVSQNVAGAAGGVDQSDLLWGGDRQWLSG
tara:strand:+ start:97 stop:249 length:153 start_codon:yes stop_codon:yes gene_type:complete